MDDGQDLEMLKAHVATLRAQLAAKGVSFKSNDSISEYLDDFDRAAIELVVRDAAEQMLQALLIDTENDPNSEGTAKRLAKMYVHEVFRGRYYDAPVVTTFPNQQKLDQLYVVGPVRVLSSCSHHFVPVIGQAWFGVLPGDHVLGLSKFARIAESIMARPQIQEDATVQLADAIEREFSPAGLAVVVRAQHMCCAWRGVKDNSLMTTSIMRGVFATDMAAKAELMHLITGHQF